MFRTALATLFPEVKADDGKAKPSVPVSSIMASVKAAAPSEPGKIKMYSSVS
jgi:hypothetical protein